MAFKKDQITIEILDDGVIKINSDSAISAPNHTNATKLVDNITKDAGGKRTQQSTKHKHVHAHSHADGTVHQH